jgi:hypothetical protein
MPGSIRLQTSVVLEAPILYEGASYAYFASRPGIMRRDFPVTGELPDVHSTSAQYRAND